MSKLFYIEVIFFLQGFLRFEEAGAAQKAIDAIKEANDGKVMLKEKELECRVIEGKFFTLTQVIFSPTSFL